MFLSAKIDDVGKACWWQTQVNYEHCKLQTQFFLT